MLIFAKYGKVFAVTLINYYHEINQTQSINNYLINSSNNLLLEVSVLQSWASLQENNNPHSHHYQKSVHTHHLNKSLSILPKEHQETSKNHHEKSKFPSSTPHYRSLKSVTAPWTTGIPKNSLDKSLLVLHFFVLWTQSSEWDAIVT